MKAARMSNEDALDLVDDDLDEIWCKPESPKRGEVACARMELDFFSHRSAKAIGEDALQARRLMETLNALACCRGFAVEENPAFWKKMINEKTQEDVTCEEQHALAPSIFSRYTISTPRIERGETVAWGIVSCCSKDYCSQGMILRRDIHHRLRGFFEREPPMLDIQFEFIEADPSRTFYGCIRRFKRCLLEANRMWKISSPSNVQERVAITIYAHNAGDETLLELAECASIPCVELRFLSVRVSTRRDRSIANELSFLMREIVRVNTVRTMKWRFEHSDAQCLASIFSAIPSMTSLESFAVRCEDLLTNPHTALATYDAQSYYFWATYALVARTLTGCPMSAGLVIAEGAKKLCKRVLESLSALIGDGARDAATLCHGSTATLMARSFLSTVSHESKRFQHVEDSLIALEARQVDVIALCGYRAIIVWPGSGLMWVELSQLQGWKARPIEALKSTARHYSIVTDLVCCNEDVGAIAQFLKCFGSSVKRLRLREVDPERQEEFARILLACPRLENLFIASLGSITPLLRAYEDGNCTVSRLTIEKVANDEAAHSILKVLAIPGGCMANHVKQVGIGNPSLTSEGITLVASVLTTNRQLDTIRFCARSPETGVLCKFIDEPLRQTLTSKLSVYTFLLAARHHRMLRSLPLACGQVIAEFAATPVLRHVAWETSEV